MIKCGVGGIDLPSKIKLKYTKVGHDSAIFGIGKWVNGNTHNLIHLLLEEKGFGL
jgi:hypothetical protein